MIKTIIKFSVSIILFYIAYRITPFSWLELITLLALIAAIFRDKLFPFFFSPKLVITASRNLRHFGVAQIKDQSTGEILYRSAYFGVIVENHGISTAKNLELLFNGLESNIIPDFSRFISLHLQRSWIHIPFVKALHKRVPIRFDICFIRDTDPNILNFALYKTPNELTDITCNEPDESFFEFEVVALSTNAPLARRRVRITYNGNYIDGFDVNEI